MFALNVLLLKRPGRFVVGALVAWIAVTAGGLFWLWDFASVPGTAGHAPALWPAESPLRRAADRPTLVMFVHPKCACTRASVAELDRTMAVCGDRVVAYVIFARPQGMPADWERTGLWRAAERIPGVQVCADIDGEEARRFGARTSGQVMLYDAAGRLLFQGGITAARGHEGDNAGRAAVIELVGGGRPAVRQTRVFGCALGNEGLSLQRE